MTTLKIKEMAQKRGFTQKMLAEKLGISLGGVRPYYQKDELSIQSLKKIAESLDCKLWQLIANEDEIIAQAEGDVILPNGERIPIRKLKFCYDSMVN